MNYELHLNNGLIYSLNGEEIDAQKLTDTLNSNQVGFINFGGIIVIKHAVVGIFPILNTSETKEEE
ncbi:hypothetical protein [Lysinibacillus sp. NPDC086135]|uniref:hypothetical protein n=1 Tax=Lysinibacillus sp. NPDC086135 TaxID=3364130 RepID=UPI0038047AA6